MADLATPASPAPAQSADPAVVSAAHAAIVSEDTGAYREARRAERAGKPLPEVTLTADPDTASEGDPDPIPVTPPTSAAPTPQLSKRQQEINERSRRAVDAATTQLRDEVAQLRAQLAAPRRETPADPATPPAKDTPAWKHYASLPTAPKFAEFDGENAVGEYVAAMSLFITDQRTAEGRQQAQFTAHRERFEQQSTAYGERLRKSAEANPNFLSTIPAELHDAKPLSALRKGERPTFANAVAEVGFAYSEDPGRFYAYLGGHMDQVNAIAALPGDQIIPALIRLDGRLSGVPATPVAPKPHPKTLSDAPDVQTLGSKAAEATDPKSGAIKRGDTRAYREIRRQERAAGRR